MSWQCSRIFVGTQWIVETKKQNGVGEQLVVESAQGQLFDVHGDGKLQPLEHRNQISTAIGTRKSGPPFDLLLFLRFWFGSWFERSHFEALYDALKL